MSAENEKAFHAHLDVCVQCANRPFDLCAIGSKLLHAAVAEDEADRNRCGHGLSFPHCDICDDV